jgi:hypothetical protein
MTEEKGQKARGIDDSPLSILRSSLLRRTDAEAMAGQGRQMTAFRRLQRGKLNNEQIFAANFL